MVVLPWSAMLGDSTHSDSGEMSNLWRIFLLDWYLLDLLPYDTMFWMTLEYMLCFFLWVKQVALALWSIQVPTHLERRFAQIHLILLKTRCFNGCFVASVCSFPSTKQIKTGFLSPPHSTLTAQKKTNKTGTMPHPPQNHVSHPLNWWIGGGQLTGHPTVTGTESPKRLRTWYLAAIAAAGVWLRQALGKYGCRGCCCCLLVVLPDTL